MDLQQKLQAVQNFILGTFGDTLKPASGCLAHPYISPGGPYAVQLWDWDSYWTIFAIINVAKRLRRNDILDMIRPHAIGTVLNFLEHHGEDGSIPIVLAPDQEDVFDCKKSSDNNMAKPFLGQLCALLYDNGMLSCDAEMAANMENLHRYHLCCAERYQDGRTGLYFWATDWAIGVDDDPAAWGRPAKSCATLYQNVFMYKDMVAAAHCCEALGLTEYAEEYREKSVALSAAIEKYCWDNREKSYFSVDLQCRVNRTKNAAGWELNENLDAFWYCLQLKVLGWCSILPFWAGLGTETQFKQFISENLVAERLWSNYGIRSLSKDEAMYSPEIARGNPSNWLGPIWMIANYITWETLSTRGYEEKATELSRKLINLLYDDLEKNGSFHEYYSPENGHGVTNPGFMSWNALAALLTI